MISHKYRFIYTRVAKTGSTAVITLTQKHVDDLIDVDDNSWNQDKNHVPLYYLKKNIPEDVFNSYFKFGFVRNPWDRLVSAYHYAIKWHKIYMPQSLYLERFNNISNWIKQLKFRQKYGSQLNYVEGCDFIGKFENLQEDFNIICDKIGIPKQQLPYKNKSNHKHYTEYYDDETREIVAEKYAKDIKYFGYEFGK